MAQSDDMKFEPFRDTESFNQTESVFVFISAMIWKTEILSAMIMLLSDLSRKLKADTVLSELPLVSIPITPELASVNRILLNLLNQFHVIAISLRVIFSFDDTLKDRIFWFFAQARYSCFFGDRSLGVIVQIAFDMPEVISNTSTHA